MFKHFQRDFILLKYTTLVFFDPEPAGPKMNYHVKFNVQGVDYHVIMRINDSGEWEMEDRDEQGRLERYEQQFIHAIREENGMTDNL